MESLAPADAAVASIAAAIGEPARARMLLSLMDGHARTSTELSVVAGVSAPTASAHLQRLRAESLVLVVAQGKHRYYRLAGAEVARALEGLGVLAGGWRRPFAPTAPARLRHARTCYDHLAGAVGVRLLDRWLEGGWVRAAPDAADRDYELTPAGTQAFADLGIDATAARSRRRRFAYGCLDWSERRPHLGGALAAAFLQEALRRKWFVSDLDSRILAVTAKGRAELAARFGLQG
ncbi:MAG TPA: winged helix-turn-helix domain-containing protein [Opitutaceae bacterium]|nr:winged helix-turn-helix domain-containing protein [Opitutaceae bacterium]